MPIHHKVLRGSASLLLLVIGFNGLSKLSSPIEIAENFKTNHHKVSLSANYPDAYPGPALAPYTPSMGPNPNMYFQGGAPRMPGYPTAGPQYQDPRMMMPQGSPYMGGGMPQQMQMPYGQPGMPPGMGLDFGNPAGLDPNDPVQQALSLHQAGRYADAIQIYESIIINNPPDPRIYASIADAHYRLGNTERALKYTVESLKLDPNYSSGHLLLGTILGEMGDVVRSVRAYERVIALDQNNPYAYYNLGLLYYKKSDIRTAIEYLERARDLNPNDPKIWNNLGVAYYDNGQFTKATGAYSQALGLDPSYETAKRNLELVRGKMPATTISTIKAKKTIKKGSKKKTVKKAVKKK
jgi:tetratricopeptide (TPR) repeat protein